MLAVLCKSLPKYAEVPRDFLIEIEHFKSMNSIKDFESINVEEIGIKRPSSSIPPYNEKKIKNI